MERRIGANKIKPDADRRRALIRLVAAKSPGMPTVGPSAGDSCELCGGPIAPGTLQYEVNIGRTVIVGEDCYHLHLRSIIELPRESHDHPN